MTTMLNDSPRVPSLDWLRSLTVLLLIPFHSALIFITGYYWWITSDQKNLAAQAFTTVLDQYHMPLLFLVAGAATWFSLGKRTAGQYSVERIKRLVVPAILCSIIFVVPNHYLSQMHYYNNDELNKILAGIGELPPFGSFLEHYPSIFMDKVIPFTTNWNPGVLWFLWYLILYTCILLPVFWVIRKKGQRLVSGINWFLEKRGSVFLLVIPIALLQVYKPGPILDTWTFHNFSLFYYVPFFVYGFFLFTDSRALRGLDKSGPIAIIGGIITMTLFMLLVFPPLGRAPLYSAYWTFFSDSGNIALGEDLIWVLRSITEWFWIIGLLYLGKRFLNFSNGFTRYANDAVLPFYILHETGIVTISYFVIQLDMPVLPTYAIIIGGASLMTLGLYEIFKRTNVTRFITGMKPKIKPVIENSGPVPYWKQ